MKKLSILFFIFLLSFCTSKEPEEKQKSKKELLIEKEKALIIAKKRFNELKIKVRDLEKEVNNLKSDVDTKMFNPVAVRSIELEEFQHYISFPGKVDSESNIIVVPELNGVLKEKFAKKGDYVKKGQKIAKLDITILQKNIEEAESQLNFAQMMFEKQKNLWEKQIGTEIQYLEAKNTKEILENKISTLKEQAIKSIITAPLDGVIDDFFIRIGEMASASRPFARIIQTKKMKVIAEVPEKYSLDIKKNLPIQILFSSLGITIRDKIDFVEKFINPENRSFIIESTFNNKIGVKINTTAIVTLRNFYAKQAVVVDDYLIQKEMDGDSFVYIVEQNEEGDFVKKIFIRIGLTYQGKTLVVEGLKKGDKLIYEGYSEIGEGDQIRILNSI